MISIPSSRYLAMHSVPSFYSSYAFAEVISVVLTVLKPFGVPVHESIIQALSIPQNHRTSRYSA